MDSKRKIIELDLNSILPNRFQPRIAFDESGLIELTESIKAHGVINPIIVRKLGEKFEIIAGERRYKASTLAGLKTIPAIITDFNDKESSEIALIENVQRRDLTPIEEAISYKRILDMNYLTQDELAKKLGKTQSTIANKLRLLNLCDDVQEALLEGKISERHARSLLKVKNSAQQKLLLDRIINERLTVRRTDEEIDKMFNENENQKSKYINTDNLNIPTSNIIGDDNIETLDTNVSSGVDMLYNQATMNIPKIMGEDIKQYEENQNNKPILNEPVEELHFGFEDNNDVHNPGFMDISNIESNAKDIFENKPARPFFFSDPEPVAPVAPVIPDVSEQPMVTTVEDERSPLINPMFMQSNEESVAGTPVIEDNVPQTVVSSDGFDFDFVPAETVKTNQVDIPELSDLEQFSSFNTAPAQEATSSLMDDATVNTEPEVSSEILSVEEPVTEETNVVESISNVDSQPEVLNIEEPVMTESSVVSETPVVEPTVENVTSTIETPVVNEIPVIENVQPVDNTQPEVKEEPKKEEKKSFFDRLKALVDTKPEKLEEPVVESMISEPVNEATPVEPEVLNIEEPVMTESSVVPETLVIEPTVENVTSTIETPVVNETPVIENVQPVDNLVTSQPEVLSFDSLENTISSIPNEPTMNNEDIEVLDFGTLDDNNSDIQNPVVESMISEPINEVTPVEPEVLSIEEPIVSTQDSEQTISEIPMEENNVSVMTDNLVNVQPETLNSNEIESTTDIPFITNENNVDVDDAINSLEATANDTKELVDSIDATPIMENEGIERVEDIPEDIMSSLNNEVSTLDDSNTKELNDMPAELAEIVANPELTNNFTDNEDVPSEPSINVEQSLNQDTISSNYEMPFQTILDGVVIPEENVVEETPIIEPIVTEDNNENSSEFDVSIENDKTDIESVDSEFEEFTPASLPIYDDEVENQNSIANIPYTPVYEDNTITDIPSTNEETVVNMGGAMKVIREATEQLQKLGFIVDTEEFDFENMYQVIFKINKNSK